MPRSGRIVRLKLRLTPAPGELRGEAARGRRLSTEAFVLETALPLAEELVPGRLHFRLSRRAWKEFLQLTTETRSAVPLARGEAAEFLRRYRGTKRAES